MDINRKTAYDILLDIEKNDSYSNIATNAFIKKNSPDKESFVREIVYGVLKNKILLDYYLDKLIKNGTRKTKKQDLTLLRMGLYQIIYMDSVPEYAAVSETVNMAKSLARGRERFINGVLRGFLKNREQLELPNAGPAETADSEFSDNPARYLAIRYSISEWIVKLWLDTYGYEKTERILASANETPKLAIRVNWLKIDTDSLQERLESQGFKVDAENKTDRGLLVSGSRLLETEEYKQGLFSVQDVASIMASDFTLAEPGDLVIDVCAAPGGKSLATAELMKNEGEIIACDIYEHKLELIEKQAQRLGVSIIKTRRHDSTEEMTEFFGKADRVICDVPCSGLGVIARKPEIKYKQEYKGLCDLAELIEIQARILSNAARYVKPGGKLVYSTCTIDRHENEEQIRRFLQENEDFEPEKELQLFPFDGTDGFYICRMMRKNVE